MKERLVKGTNLIGVVRLLRWHRHQHPLPDMDDWERDLLQKRVATSTWYALKVFDSLLQIAHRFVYDGSEAAAQSMGRTFGQALARDRAAQGLVHVEGDPLGALADMAGRWRMFFNFGELLVVPWPSADGEKGARLQINGYPDMSACHGHSIIGWSMQLVEDAGAKDVVMRVEERPWMHNSVLTYTLQWS